MKKEVREAVKYAASKGFAQIPRSGHAVLLLRCPSGCCQISVSGTPRSPGNHAKMIRARVDKCPGLERTEDEDA